MLHDGKCVKIEPADLQDAVDWIGDLPNHPLYITGELAYPPVGLKDIAKLIAAYFEETA